MACASAAGVPAWIIRRLKVDWATTSTPTTMIAIAMKATAIETSVIPVARLRNRRNTLSDRAVAKAAHGHDVTWRPHLFAQLVAQPSDVHVNRPFQSVPLRRSIERVEQRLAREHASARLHQRDEKAELGRGQAHRLALTAHLDAVEVDHEVAMLDHAMSAR